MKRNVWTVLLALVLAAILPCTALAAPGSMNIARGDELRDTYGDSVRGGCVLDDALYLYGSEHLFAYRVGDAEVTAIELEFPELEEDERRDLECVFSDGEGLWALCSRYEFDGEVDDARATFGEEPMEDADFGDFVEDYGDDSHLAQINNACYVDGWLMLRVFDAEGDTQVYALEMESGDGFYIDGPEGISCITPYEDGELLIETFDFEEWAVGFYLYDPEEDVAESVSDPVPMDGDVSGNGLEDLVYSAESGKLFYLSGGNVMAMEGFDVANATPVVDLPSNIHGEGGSVGLLLPGDYFVTVSSSVTAIRSTDPDAAPTKRLVVDGTTFADAINAAYYNFTNSHSDVSVVLANSYFEGADLIEKMMYQDSSVDIFALMVNSEAFDALYSRGFMMELDDTALTSAVAQMYPTFQDALMRDGKLVAVPMDVIGRTQGFDYDAFEEIGIAREDVPTSWREFLEMLPELADRLPEDESVSVFDSFETQEWLRRALFNQILNSWSSQETAAGEELCYDNPELAELLQLVLDADFDALGVSEESDDGGYVDYDTNKRVLFTYDNAGCALGNMTEGTWTPTPLRAREDLDACIPLNVTAMFVNPYSKNQEEAQDFLVEVINNLNAATLYNLSDEYSEPVRDAQREKDIEDARAQIDAMKARLEKADPLDAPAMEEEIANAEEHLADMEKNVWLISAENIEWYRSHADALAAQHYNYLDANDDNSELSDLLEQVMAGRMDVGNFLKQIDRKVHMRATEGN